MSVNEHTIKHLEMIQAVISRLANSSFQIKGWSITLVSAIFAIAAAKETIDHKIIFAAPFSTTFFWWLDSYFVRQERLFRKLYDFVRLNLGQDTDFAMDTKQFSSVVDCTPRVMFSGTLLCFYSLMVLLSIAAVCFLAK